MNTLSSGIDLLRRLLTEFRASRFLLALAALVVVLPVFGAAPGTSPGLQGATGYGGLIECLSVEGFADPTCDMVELPIGRLVTEASALVFPGAAVADLPGVDSITALRLVVGLWVIVGFAGTVFLVRVLGGGLLLGLGAAIASAYASTIHSEAGHLFFLGVGSYLLPGALALVIAALRRPAHSSWVQRVSFGVGVGLACCLLLAAHSGYVAVFFAFAAGLCGLTYWLLTRRREVFWSALSIGVGIAFALVVVGLAYAQEGIKGHEASIESAESRSVPLAQTIFGQPGTSLEGDVWAWTYQITRDRDGDVRFVRRVSFGLFLWGAAALGTLKGRDAFKPARIALLVTCVAFVGVSLGPVLHWSSPFQDGLLLPWAGLFVDSPLTWTRAIWRFAYLPAVILPALVFGGLRDISDLGSVYRMLGVTAALIALLPSSLGLVWARVSSFDQYEAFVDDVVAVTTVDNSEVGILLPYRDPPAGGVTFVGPLLAAAWDLDLYNAATTRRSDLQRDLWPDEISRIVTSERNAMGDPEIFVDTVVAAIRSDVVDTVLLGAFDWRWDMYSWPPGAADVEEWTSFWRPALAILEARCEVAPSEYFWAVSLCD